MFPLQSHLVLRLWRSLVYNRLAPGFYIGVLVAKGGKKTFRLAVE